MNAKALETEFPAELKNARRQGTGNLSKTGGASVIHDRIVPVGPIEDVEGIRLELHAHALAERQIECLSQR